MLLLTHQIAGITFRTESDVLLPYLQKGPFERFRVDDDVEPDVCQRIRQLDLDSLTLPPLNGKERERISYCVGFQQRWLENPIFRSPEIRARLHACLDRPEQVNIEIAGRGMVIRDFACCELDLFYPPEIRGFFAGPRVIAGFRNLFSTFLTNFSAVMIHSAGVIRNGTAALFLAPDGGGKTMVVERSTGQPILNDDQVILRQEDNAFIAYGTPLGLITSGPKRARVGGFFLLERAERFELIPLKPVEALEYFWSEYPNHRLFLPKHLRIRAFEILYNACHQAPVYRMRLPKNCVDWEATDAAMVR